MLGVLERALRELPKELDDAVTVRFEELAASEVPAARLTLRANPLVDADGAAVAPTRVLAPIPRT